MTLRQFLALIHKSEKSCYVAKFLSRVELLVRDVATELNTNIFLIANYLQ